MKERRRKKENFENRMKKVMAFKERKKIYHSPQLTNQPTFDEGLSRKKKERNIIK